MPPHLDPDTLFAVINEVALFRDWTTLLSFSSTCSAIRSAWLPYIFADVRWPHASKHNDSDGLEFFPEPLWKHFRRLSLIWPDHWPDSSPPLWGDKYYVGGDYHPRHLDKLVSALSRMSALTSFYANCPFYPPSSVLNALIRCPSIREISVADTPLYVSMIPNVPADCKLETISIVPVAEALRVGEGPYEPKYHEVTYYIREYRKKYKNDILARFAATAILFRVGKASSLRRVQVSGDLCTLDELAEHDWPNLDTLILTGHAPRLHSTTTELVDVLVKMPKLTELRLLFATTKGDASFRVVPQQVSAKGNDASVFRQLKHLALSNACKLSGVFRYTAALERLAVCAIIDHPWVPIALSRSDVDGMLKDMAVESETSKLKRLRIMVEDKVSPELCRDICMQCPVLEALEVEICGYHDGKPVFAWSEFSAAFSTLAHIRHLRICIQFPEFDETDVSEPWRSARKECAVFLASHMPTLQRVGFEYRKRTGTHRYEDGWLEWDIVRGGREGLQLFELTGSWYPFPEVWFPVSLPV